MKHVAVYKQQIPSVNIDLTFGERIYIIPRCYVCDFKFIVPVPGDFFLVEQVKIVALADVQQSFVLSVELFVLIVVYYYFFCCNHAFILLYLAGFYKFMP